MQAPERDRAERFKHIRWAFFALPVFLFLYTFPAMISSANLLLFAFLAATPIVCRNMDSGKKVLFYLFSEMIVMLLIIIATAAMYGLDHTTSLNNTLFYESVVQTIPVLSIVMTAEGAFPFVFIMEGLKSEKLSKITYSFIIATGTLLNELAVMHFAEVQNTTFLNAFEYVQTLEGSSVYSLLVNGTQAGMPLQLFVPSVWPVILSLFVLSFLAFFSYIYITEGGSRTVSLERFTKRIALGTVAGISVMLISLVASPAGLQFLVVSVAVMATTTAVIVSNSGANGTMAWLAGFLQHK